MDEIERTRLWLERAVIGLNLCPFAKAPHSKGLIKYELTKTRQQGKLLSVLSEKLLYLQATPPEICETLLLIHPNVLRDFLDYNDFLDDVDALLERLDLDSVFQVVSFHPDYRFAEVSDADDITHYTNRSPYPMLHILRQASVDQVLKGADDQALADMIVERNQNLLRRMGKAGWDALWQ